MMKRIIFSGMVLLAGFIGMINAESSCQIKLSQLRSELSIPMLKETGSNRRLARLIRIYTLPGAFSYGEFCENDNFKLAWNRVINHADWSLQEDELHCFLDELEEIKTIDSFECFLDNVGMFLYEYCGPKILEVIYATSRDMMREGILIEAEVIVFYNKAYSSIMKNYIGLFLANIEFKAKELGLEL